MPYGTAGICPRWSASRPAFSTSWPQLASSWPLLYSFALFRVTIWFVPKLHTGTQYGNNIGNHMARLCRHCASALAVTMFRLTLDRVSLDEVWLWVKIGEVCMTVSDSQNDGCTGQTLTCLPCLAGVQGPLDVAWSLTHFYHHSKFSRQNPGTAH